MITTISTQDGTLPLPVQVTRGHAYHVHIETVGQVCTSLLLAASAKASWAENVLLPTPPFPDNTKILCLMLRMRCSMATRSGSGPFGAVAQISWLGHPAHAADLPAVSLLVPGQSAPEDFGQSTLNSEDSRHQIFLQP